MVLTLIRTTRKTTLNCMSALSVCLVLNVHCTQSQQLRTICTCVTEYTHKLSDTHLRCKELLGQNWFSVSQTLVLCLRIVFDISIRPTINPVPSQRRYYRLRILFRLMTLAGKLLQTSLTHFKFKICLSQPHKMLQANKVLRLVRSRRNCPIYKM